MTINNEKGRPRAVEEHFLHLVMQWLHWQLRPHPGYGEQKELHSVHTYFLPRSGELPWTWVTQNIKIWKEKSVNSKYSIWCLYKEYLSCSTEEYRVEGLAGSTDKKGDVATQFASSPLALFFCSFIRLIANSHVSCTSRAGSDSKLLVNRGITLSRPIAPRASAA